MVVMKLRSPLRELAGSGEVELEAGTVGEAIRGLEAGHPRLSGWVLDDRGRLREHVTVFVNGERAPLDAPVHEGDQMHILPAISGGSVQTLTRTQTEGAATSEDDAELLVGTRKGLFVLRGRRGGPMEVAARHFAGQVAEFAMRDRRTGTYFVSVTHGQYGPRVFRSDDPLAEEWEQTDGPVFPEDAGATVDRIWLVRKGEEDGVLWAGVAPAALFKSEDDGRTWHLNRGLWDDPSRPHWQPGAGGLACHSICTWPGDPSRIAVGISAAGVWLSEDGGESWRRGNKGLVARYLPEEAREGAVDLCVHNMHRAPLEPETLYIQFHWGVYRSDDAGESWNDVGTDKGLPSDFGFPLVIDPADPNAAYVIPLKGDFDRITTDGRVTVFETRDRGETWTERSLGLPQNDAYLTILRQAFCHDGRAPLGLYFGAESGEVFGSPDGGVTWATVIEHLPTVTSVRCSS
jgi:molybdopterin converting factor small subunit